MNKIIFIFFLFVVSCKNEVKNTNVDSTQISAEHVFKAPEWTKNGVIYEVNIRQYTKEGTINAFSDHIERLKTMGVDILWFMPVYPISKSKRKGNLGSYYAVSDFRSVNPEFGTKEDLKNLIEKIHAYNMKAIFDWVPNHTGWDHVWIKQHPDFYTRDSLGKITDPLDDINKSMGWTDVADLNYDNIEMRKTMIEDMKYVLKEYNIDGFRQDVAWGVPLDFWKECTNELLKTKPDIFLLAEADLPEQLNENTFHSAYGWKLHHLLNAIAKGEKKASDIDIWLKDEKTKFQNGTLMHFTSNHDENSWQGTEKERMGEGAQTFAVLTMTLDGIPLIYSGQEEPLEKRLKFFEKDDINFDKFKLATFYETLCRLKNQEEALWCGLNQGGTVVKLGDSDNIYAFKREKNKSKVVVLLNLSKNKEKFTINEDVKNMMEIFTKEKINFAAGQFIEMLPWEYKVLITETK